LVEGAGYGPPSKPPRRFLSAGTRLHQSDVVQA